LVNELLAIPHDMPDGTWENLAKRIEEKAKVIQAKLSGITSAASIGSAAAEVVKVQERLNKIRRNQYNAYQLWAVGQLNQAFIQYNRYKWTSPGGNAAWNILINNKIETIDIGLMSPDVARCYNDIVPKLLVQFKPTDIPDWYKLCVDTKKIALEDK
jgi:hypothetical protein